MSYSQWNEDQFVLEFFKNQNTGFFLDIGAGDGVNHSNTRSLFERGWEGLLVEANKVAFAQLLQVYGGVDRVAILHAAITTRNGIVEFYEHPTTGWSSLDHAWVRSNNGFSVRRVMGLRLDSLNLPPIDFLSIDTEGHDASIIETMVDIQPKLILAETDKLNSKERIDKILGDRGYSQVFWNKGNTGYSLGK